MLKNEGSCNDEKVVLFKRYKTSNMESGKDASVLESRTVRTSRNKCQPLERERINSTSSSPIKCFTTSKYLESTQRERRKIRGFDKELSEGDKRLKRAKDFGSRRWLYSSVVRGKLDATVDSHLDTEGQTWNDSIIWVKGNFLQRDDEEPLGIRFRTVKQSKCKVKVERKESLLDEVAEKGNEFELMLEGLGLSRKKRVDSRSNKNWKFSSAESSQPSKMALKCQKKRMLKALPTSSTTGSYEVAKDKRRAEPSGESGEKVAEGRYALMDDLREVEERDRLAVLQGEEDTSKMVARLVKGIWLGIEEEESELKKANVETKANLDEMVEERDRLGHHLMLKGYSEEEVDTIKADTYAEEEDKEETKVGHVQKGNANLRECQHKLDAALIREKALEGEIKAKESLVKRKVELLKDILASEELNVEIWKLRVWVVDLEAMNLAESAKYIEKLEENVIYHAKVDVEMTELKNEYARLESRLERLRVRFAIMVIPDASRSNMLKAIVTYFIEEVKGLELE
ncbi:hypothetical protein GIB67_032090 [Kingdonia uniflora]|uniref:Uncharacterized protein n=1 Tax=Kingdonia uniflora TaxID=39325 RepID=A0A7J7MWK5_9MAGN|nr:hypothetical protein GIB67_032090 [Kingdonia uniflora]